MPNEHTISGKSKLQAEYNGNWYNLQVIPSGTHNLLKVCCYDSEGSSLNVTTHHDGQALDRSLAVASALYAFNGATWDRLRTQDVSYPNLRVCLAFYNSIARIYNLAHDSVSTASEALFTSTFLHGFNGSSWDRIRTHLSFTETITATGATTSKDTLTGMRFHTIHITADNTGFSISLEGSLDGNNWFSLYDITNASDTEYVIFINYKLTRYLRFNCKNMGSATSITARYYGMRWDYGNDVCLSKKESWIRRI